MNEHEKIIINGIEEEPIEKFKLHEILSPSEIEKIIKDKQKELQKSVSK